MPRREAAGPTPSRAQETFLSKTARRAQDADWCCCVTERLPVPAGSPPRFPRAPRPRLPGPRRVAPGAGPRGWRWPARWWLQRHNADVQAQPKQHGEKRHSCREVGHSTGVQDRTLLQCILLWWWWYTTRTGPAALCVLGRARRSGAFGAMGTPSWASSRCAARSTSTAGGVSVLAAPHPDCTGGAN